VKTHLAIAATSLLQAASALMATEVSDPKESSGVERIDLGDHDWPGDDEWESDPE
jgi:hypothetical protein